MGKCELITSVSNFTRIYHPVGNQHLVADRPVLHQDVFRKKPLLTSLAADFCRTQTTKTTRAGRVLYCKNVKGEAFQANNASQSNIT